MEMNNWVNVENRVNIDKLGENTNWVEEAVVHCCTLWPCLSLTWMIITDIQISIQRSSSGLLTKEAVDSMKYQDNFKSKFIISQAYVHNLRATTKTERGQTSMKSHRELYQTLLNIILSQSKVHKQTRRYSIFRF